MDWNAIVNSRLADTAPALVGVLAILIVLVPVGLYMARMLRDAVNASAAGMAEALRNNTTALDKIRERDDARTDRHFEVLKQLGESCLGDHRVNAEKTDEMKAALVRIEARLGND